MLVPSMKQMMRSRVFASRLLSTLAIIDHSKNKIAPGSFSAVTAARQLGPVTLLVAGSNTTGVAEQGAKLEGIEKVLLVDNGAYDHGISESFASLVSTVVKDGGFTHVVAASSSLGKDVLPRIGALLDVQPISDVIRIENEHTFVRPIYAGNALETVKSMEKIQLITVRPAAFEATTESASSAQIVNANDPNVVSKAKFISEDLVKNERPDLGSASRVISGGRGLKDKENFQKLLYPLADKLNAAVGASRAAVDSGFCDNSLQVGQTGKIVAPELYIAVGISGAIQHLAGMKDSKVIAAINKDSDAPIFHVADVGLVADLFDAVPELTEKL